MPTPHPHTPSSQGSSDAPASLISPPAAANADATAKELERLSINFVHALNAHDYDFDKSEEARELRLHIAPDWRALFDTNGQDFGRTVTFEEQVARWKERVLEYPHVRFAPVAVSSDVDKAKGWASVFCEMEVSGIGNVALQAMNELKWRRDVDGAWWCYFVIGLRGSRMNSGYD